MNIILAEESQGGGQLPERSFSKAVIVVGRDAIECDVAFDGDRYPMVSRRHAEIRWQDGKWIAVDLNSSYGTFVNERQIAQPTEIYGGTPIQFGVDGPVLRVVWFEVSAGAAADPLPPPAVPIAAVPEPVPQKKVEQPVSQKQSPPDVAASLQFDGSSRPPFAITKKEIWFGREPECDVVFEASAGTVSRRHASIRIESGAYLLTDNNSFNGTLVNEQRITATVPLYHNDEIRLGAGGPIVRFDAPAHIAAGGPRLAGQGVLSTDNAEISKTVVLKLNNSPRRKPPESGEPQLLSSVSFAGKRELVIGRDPSSDIQLDGLQISKRHAHLLLLDGEVAVEDLGSTNGVFVNGQRIARQTLNTADSVQIGSFLLRIDEAANVGVFDTRSKTRVDAVGLTREVKDRAAGGKLKLLDSVSLSIQPNEFVGILGPSGAGKSTLMEAMNGVRPAESGNVLINDLDLYGNFGSLKQQIGYVPQEDIIHRELSVYRTLYYVGKLRLSRDVSSPEIDQIIDEVLDVTGLAGQKYVPVNQLSGGQRKRVSMAVELITKPAVIFLDEPTSGLDPLAGDKIMRLFREIAESGRTVIMTTHAMENVRLFDKIILLMCGKLVFYGRPDEALKHFGAANFKELYDRLEQPENSASGDARQIADGLRAKFHISAQYARYIQEPLRSLGSLQQSKLQKKRRLGVFGAAGQWITLSRRYFAVLFKDKLNLLILFAQAPLIALLTYFVMGANQPRDFVYFVVAIVAFWFGISVSAREIIRERAVYKRERMFNLGVIPYLFSKLTVLGIIVTVQCLMLFVPLKILDLTGIMPMPGEMLGIPQFWAMLLTAGVGIAGGLFISTLVRTSEIATSLVPLILIPQILFSGLVGVPHGVNKVIGLSMPSAWSFDTMKRFSTLDTLEPEGADPNGKTKGRGLY
ncbi:MAG TPA: FHA domain-containing protein, partial [Pyrinomonadaceae bacterium]|nr:FHA domain-containing protein [Pyrinomonadaceae bacterium]